jgi:hypothetical protein
MAWPFQHMDSATHMGNHKSITMLRSVPMTMCGTVARAAAAMDRTYAIWQDQASRDGGLAVACAGALACRCGPSWPECHAACRWVACLVMVWY